MSTDRYDDLVLGSGAGGKLLSWHLARAGRRTAVVERRYVGGSCPNINCLPSKNEVWSAKVADLIHHAAAFGVVTGSTAIDMRRVLQRKRDMVDGLIAMHLEASRSRARRGSGDPAAEPRTTYRHVRRHFDSWRAPLLEVGAVLHWSLGFCFDRWAAGSLEASRGALRSTGRRREQLPHDARGLLGMGDNGHTPRH